MCDMLSINLEINPRRKPTEDETGLTRVYLPHHRHGTVGRQNRLICLIPPHQNSARKINPIPACRRLIKSFTLAKHLLSCYRNTLISAVNWSCSQLIYNCRLYIVELFMKWWSNGEWFLRSTLNFHRINNCKTVSKTEKCPPTARIDACAQF